MMTLMVKSLLSEKVQLMFSLMIENALQKSHFKERIDRIETSSNQAQNKLKSSSKQAQNKLKTSSNQAQNKLKTSSYQAQIKLKTRSNVDDSQIRLDGYTS